MPGLVLHAAAWTDVDGAESDPEGAARVNVEGTRNVVALGSPVVYYSTDYVFDGRKSEPYVESDEPAPLSVYGRTKLDGEREVREGWIVRSSWLFGWTSHNFVRTMLRLGAEQDEVAVVDDQRGSPTYVGHLAAATAEAPRAAVRHVPRCGGRRLHVGGVRRGDLRGGGARVSRAADHHRRVRRGRLRGRPTRSSAASEGPRSSPTGARASEPAWLVSNRHVRGQTPAMALTTMSGVRRQPWLEEPWPEATKLLHESEMRVAGADRSRV